MIPVNAEVIEHVVTMGGGRENRTEQKSGRTEFDGIVQTLPDMAETMEHARSIDSGGFGADKAERIDLPQQSVLNPVRHQLFLRIRPISRIRRGVERPTSPAGRWRDRRQGHADRAAPTITQNIPR
jgi:hypothetical protein